MSVHLYCIVPRRSMTAELLAGIDAGPVRAIDLDEIEAWVSDVERGSAPTVANVQQHDAVLAAALHAGVTPVPARFGNRFDTDDACRSALADQAPALRTLVAEMQGFVEMTLLVSSSVRRTLRTLEPVIPADARGTGRQYLESLRARERTSNEFRAAASALLARVSAAVSPHVRRVAAEQAPARTPLVSVSHLVERRAADDYRRAAESVAPGADLQVLIIGPRAPYSFCSVTGGTNLAD